MANDAQPYEWCECTHSKTQHSSTGRCYACNKICPSMIEEGHTRPHAEHEEAARTA